MRPFGLRYQFTWWFLLVAVVPAVAGSTYTYHVTRSSLYREAEGLMRGEAAGVADRLDDALAAVQADVVVTARQVALRALVVGGAPAGMAAPASDAERVLAEAARGAPAGNAVFGGLSPTSRSGRPSLTYAAPLVTAAGAPLGSLHVEISADALRPLMGAG